VAQKKEIAAAGRAPGVSITNISEKAEQGARGKMLVDQYGEISKAAGLAARTMPAIEANLTALNKGFDTGFGKETIAAGASVLAALGVKDAEKFATDAQQFQSNAISAVLQKQLEQKGPQTESDAKRIEQIGAQLGKTKNAKSLFDRPALKKYAVGAASAAAQIPGNAPAPARAAPAARTVVRTGTLNGRRVIQYSDGSTEYGN
jgi:hypothetical protein